jgi:hypothetical protein
MVVSCTTGCGEVETGCRYVKDPAPPSQRAVASTPSVESKRTVFPYLSALLPVERLNPVRRFRRRPKPALPASLWCMTATCSSHFIQFNSKQRHQSESSTCAPCAFLFTTPSAAMVSAFVRFFCGGQRPYSPSHLPACQPPPPPSTSASLLQHKCA